MASLSLFKLRNIPTRLTCTHMIFSVGFLLIFLLVQLLSAFFVEEIFFRSHKRLESKQAVFIVENPRSGTTFIYRILRENDPYYKAFGHWVWQKASKPPATQETLL